MFSSEFSLEPENLLPQNRCFMRGCRQFSSSHLTKCHACHGICTLSPLDAALTMRFHKARSTTRLRCAAPATQDDDGHVQSAAPATKTATHLVKTSQKYYTCHTKRFSTHYKTRLNVTKCYACHAKRSNATFETSKNVPYCRTYHRHSHTGIARTVADGWATSSEHTLNPQTPRVKREPLLRIREKRRFHGVRRIRNWFSVLEEPYEPMSRRRRGAADKAVL